MYTLILIVHVIVSLILILVILLQSGRGGLAEALGGTAAQSLFGGGVSNVLTRATAACSVIFVITCLSLAYLSTVRGRSILEQVPMISPEQLPAALAPQPAPANQSTPAVSSEPAPSPASDASTP